MLSEQIIKSDFVVNTLNWGAQTLRKEVLKRTTSKTEQEVTRHFDPSELQESALRLQPSIQQENGHYMMHIEVNKKLRFADLRKINGKVYKRGLNLYNRPVWGIMAGSKDSVLTRLRAGITEALQKEIKTKFEEGLKTND